MAARRVQCAPRALLMNDTCYSIELSSASMPLLLEATLLDESMNRLINQAAVRIGGSHRPISLDSTWLNLDQLSRRRLGFDKLGRLRLWVLGMLGWRGWIGWIDKGRWSYLERKRYADLRR